MRANKDMRAESRTALIQAVTSLGTRRTTADLHIPMTSKLDL